MATVRISETEFLRNPKAALDEARRGVDVVVEDVASHRIASLVPADRGADRPGSSIRDCIARLKRWEATHGGPAIPDSGFASDVLDFVKTHQEPLEVDPWDS